MKKLLLLILLLPITSYGRVVKLQYMHIITDKGVFWGCVNYGKLKKIKHADEDTFEWLGYNNLGLYGRDKKNAFYEDKIIKGVDLESLRDRGLGYAADKNHVFYKGNIFFSADPESFTSIRGGYSKDKNNVYYNNEPIEGADIETIAFFGKKRDDDAEYATDKNRVYYKGTVVSEHSKSFKVLEYFYSIDEESIIYFDGVYHKRVKGADINNYKLINHFIISNNKVFLFGEEMSIFDAATFDILQIEAMMYSDMNTWPKMRYFTAKDKNGIYVNGVRIGSVKEMENKVNDSNFKMRDYAKPLKIKPQRTIEFEK